jgi:hypothetical protein
LKKLLFILLFIGTSLAAFTQINSGGRVPGEIGSMAGGVGPEWNMDSRDNFAGGIALSFDYNWFNNIAVGANLTLSYNFNDFAVIEPTLMVRDYIWENCHGQLFLQLDLGGLFFHEEGQWVPMLELGVRGGFRKPVKTSFFIEPYGRIGYPFAFGIGFITGRYF